MLIRNDEDWATAVTEAIAAGTVAIDIETTGLDPRKDKIIGISIGFRGPSVVLHQTKNGFSVGYVPMTLVPDAVEIMLPLLRFDTVRKIFHNATFDMSFFLQETWILPRNVDCTLIMAACSDERRLAIRGETGGVSLDALARSLGISSDGKGTAQEELRAWCVEHGPTILDLDNHKAAGFRRAGSAWKSVLGHAPPELVAPYACVDAELPILVYEALRKQGKQALYTYDTIERDLIPLVVRMEDSPKYLDRAYIETVKADAQEKEKEVLSRYEGGVNLLSPAQVGAELAAQGARLAATESGALCTDRLALLELKDKYQIAADVLELRGLKKTIRTYCDSWLARADEDGCIYPRFPAWTTQTGRFSSRDPNFQNIPRGKLMRNAVVAPPGKKLVLIDYSQIEPRVVAHYTGERLLREAYENGRDVYASLGRILFPHTAGEHNDKQYKALFPQERQIAKTAMLAVLYGARAKKLKNIVLLGTGFVLSESRCRAIVDRVWRAFPASRGFIMRLLADVADAGYVRNMFGRVRRFRGPGGAKAKEAFNTLIQSTAADIMKRALLAVQHRVPVEVCLTVHDEIGFYAEDNEALAGIVEEAVRAMQEVAQLRVPLVAEASICDRWGDKY